MAALIVLILLLFFWPLVARIIVFCIQMIVPVMIFLVIITALAFLG